MQSWEDEDVAAALEWLKEKLAEDIKLLSSWDKYKKEVLSGSLEWSPMHTSDQFWLENSPKFEERDCQVRHFHTLKVSFEKQPCCVCQDLLPSLTLHICQRRACYAALHSRRGH